MQSTHKKIAVISDRLSGLILTRWLEKLGHHVTLIDTGDNFSAKKVIPHTSISFFPADNSLQMVLNQSAELLNQVIPSHDETMTLINETLDLPSLQVDHGEVKPFVGFGESTSPAVAPIFRYNSPTRFNIGLSTNSLFDSMLTPLLDGLKSKILSYSELTSFEIIDNVAHKIVINGSQEIFADEFIFLNSPRDLLTALPHDSHALPAKIRSRILKTPVLAKIALQIETESPLFDGRNLIMFSGEAGGNQEYKTPFVGTCLQVMTTTDEIQKPRFLSVWETFIENELCEDAEHVSSAIKYMRKNLRRAFANFGEKPAETLVVTPTAWADYTWLNEQTELSKIAKNITVQPTLTSSFMGTAADLDVALRCYQGLLQSLT